MSIATLTSGDRRTRDAVLLQLECDAEVDASAIGVAAKDYAVTLTGFVDTCAAKLAAERAARRVHGVKAVANDIQLRVRLPRTDAAIAADCVRALELRGALSDGPGGNRGVSQFAGRRPYLDEVFTRDMSEGRINAPDDVDAAVIEGAAARVRPLVTVATTVLGPLLVLPAGYAMWRRHQVRVGIAAPGPVANPLTAGGPA